MSVSERTRSIPNNFLHYQVENMKILRISVTPGQNGKTTVRLQCRDDAGNLLDSWEIAPNPASVGNTITALYKQLAVKAAEETEEESYQPKSK